MWPPGKFCHLIILIQLLIKPGWGLHLIHHHLRINYQFQFQFYRKLIQNSKIWWLKMLTFFTKIGYWPIDFFIRLFRNTFKAQKETLAFHETHFGSIYSWKFSSSLDGILRKRTSQGRTGLIQFQFFPYPCLLFSLQLLPKFFLPFSSIHPRLIIGWKNLLPLSRAYRRGPYKSPSAYFPTNFNGKISCRLKMPGCVSL